MIQLDDKDRVEVNKNSSKGNQLKWKKDNSWYKANYLGYEALAEYIVSFLLNKTNVSDYVKYELANISYNGHIYQGCISDNFLNPKEVLITLPRLFAMYLDEDVYMECERIDRTEADCVKYATDNVVKITGLSEFGKHLTLILELDAFFYNEDRHFHNIAVIYNEATEEFRYCPIFDNGGALFSDTTISFDIGMNISECYDIVRAKPFSPCFEDQVEGAQSLYGSQFRFWFTEEDVKECLEVAKEFYAEEVIQRVHDTLIEQIGKYKHLQIKEI